MPDTAGDRHPLDALAEVDCQHTRHHTMCAQCGADAVRPELERLRAALNATRVDVDAMQREVYQHVQANVEQQTEPERLRAELAEVHEQRNAALRSSSALGEANRVWQDAHAEAIQRAEQAEATIGRVEALRDDWLRGRAPTAAQELSAALDTPATATADGAE